MNNGLCEEWEKQSGTILAASCQNEQSPSQTQNKSKNLHQNEYQVQEPGSPQGIQGNLQKYHDLRKLNQHQRQYVSLLLQENQQLYLELQCEMRIRAMRSTQMM